MAVNRKGTSTKFLATLLAWVFGYMCVNECVCYVQVNRGKWAGKSAKAIRGNNKTGQYLYHAQLIAEAREAVVRGAARRTGGQPERQQARPG